MLLNKRCPRCGGTLLVNTDRYGRYVSCIRCGWNKDLTPGPPLPKTSDHDEAYPATSDGCNVSPTCFQCPLPECQYVAPATRKAWLQDQRVLAVYAEYQHLGTKAAVEATARAIKTTDRSVYRALKRSKQTLAA
jgi:ribosomal protein S27AE